MPHSYGLRARTRNLFAKEFGQSGTHKLSQYLHVYKLGDFVDIKANPSFHKGMPYRFYHGRTGRVWNVTGNAIGVELNKLVRNRIVKKRIHVRIEHVKKSKCRLDFLNRVKSNDEKRKAAKKEGKKSISQKTTSSTKTRTYCNSN